MDIHSAGFHRNTASVSVGSGFEVNLHQNNYQGVKENLKGQGDNGEITCYQIKEGSENKVASLEVFAMHGNSLQRWNDHYTGSDTAEDLENDHPYATFYRDENCTGGELRLRVNHDGSPFELTWDQLYEEEWNNEAQSVKIPSGYEIDMWGSSDQNGDPWVHYGEEANGSQVCQEVVHRNQNNWLVIRKSDE